MTRTRKAPTLVTPTSIVTLIVVVPLRVGQGQNGREHWAAAARRVKLEKDTVWYSLASEFSMAAGPRISTLDDAVTITLTRLGGRMRDDDNNTASLKPTRDAVAHWLARDDGDKRLTWKYAQEPGPAWGVRIEIHAERVTPS